jgi:N-methylhydantoinase A
MRLSVDVGGTFTDLVVDDGDGRLELHKTSTTSPDPIDGILAVLEIAASGRGRTLREFLSLADTFIHSTTRAINAVVTGTTARTAFLVTAGHPDILLIREGGRTDPFNYRVPYPQPYVPRSLTFEVPERVGAAGEIVAPLDEGAVHRIAGVLKERKVEAVAVCFLWSIVNPVHELRTGALLRELLPGVAVTLSHQLNPTLREYRRASSCCIDASLKPVMSAYLHALQRRLKESSLAGRAFAVTSQGGISDISAMAERPILSLNSGPSMAPVAGRHYARHAGGSTAIVTDAGGTTFDVSLVRNGVIPWTRETWIGPVYQGHMTGFPSVDVKSIGAGGGSIAHVDGGMLHVGPASAGSHPGPACYGRGGSRPTVTDAAVALGYIDPEFFLGGRMKLAVDAAIAAIEGEIAGPLGLSIDDAALAIIDLGTEAMVNAIEEITVKQGIDPEDTIMIGGGGAAGLNGVAIARRLRCQTVVFPDAGAALSAAGAVMSELRAEAAHTAFMRTTQFDCERADRILARLKHEAQAGSAASFVDGKASKIDYAIEGRYPSQVWEIEVPLRGGTFGGEPDVRQLVKDFHARHLELFGFADDGDEIEIVAWRAVCRTEVADFADACRVKALPRTTALQRRSMAFRDTGRIEAPSYDLENLRPGEPVLGPAIVESSFTTIVVHPGARAERANGAFVVNVRPSAPSLPSPACGGG